MKEGGSFGSTMYYCIAWQHGRDLGPYVKEDVKNTQVVHATTVICLVHHESFVSHLGATPSDVGRGAHGLAGWIAHAGDSRPFGLEKKVILRDS